MSSQKESRTVPATIELKPIGFLESDFAFKFGTPRQGPLAPGSQARLQLLPKFSGRGLLTELGGFSHVWLISFFHQNAHTRNPGRIHPPRLAGKSVGALASRSPHRPNSIGLSLAKLEKVDGDALQLSGVDLISGTPILDVKPYVAEADRPETFSGGWTESLPVTDLGCRFSAAADVDLENLKSQGRIQDSEGFRQVIAEVLRLDPRPLVYRERDHRDFVVAIRGCDVQVHFVTDESGVPGFIVDRVLPEIAKI